MKLKPFDTVINKAFGNMTIRRKLISIIMLACTLSLLLVGGVFVFWQRFNLRQSLVRNLSTQAKVIADNCKASLTFDEPQDAHDVLMTLKAEPSIIFGGIYKLDGTIFACYPVCTGMHTDRLKPAEVKLCGYVFDNNSLIVYEPVIVEDKHVGIVCLQSTLSEMHGMLEHNVAVVVAALFLISILIYFVSSELQKIISDPILDLADVAKLVSEKKEYSLRVKNSSKDEVGLLIRAFNEMLAQIQKRDLALVQANEMLEKKVEERTGDLKEEVQVRKKAEDELAQTVKKLMMSNRELREFTRIAAHDLQSPLRAIGILSDWISEDYSRKCDEKGRQNARLLLSRAKRMSRFLYAIIQYSELSLVGKKPERFNLNRILSDVIDSIEVPENIEIIVENELPVITCVRKFMRELFENLINNAIIYMDKPQGYIKIGCVDEGDYWKFHVSDNGPGIDQKYHDKIFKIFQMLSLRDETENIGMGLSIVKKIVELYDGQVWVESAVNEGSTFYFTLPKSAVNVDSNVSAEVVAAY